MQALRTAAENGLMGTFSNRSLPPKTAFLHLALSLPDPSNQPSSTTWNNTGLCMYRMRCLASGNCRQSHTYVEDFVRLIDLTGHQQTKVHLCMAWWPNELAGVTHGRQSESQSHSLKWHFRGSRGVSSKVNPHLLHLQHLLTPLRTNWPFRTQKKTAAAYPRWASKMSPTDWGERDGDSGPGSQV